MCLLGEFQLNYWSTMVVNMTEINLFFTKCERKQYISFYLNKKKTLLQLSFQAFK